MWNVKWIAFYELGSFSWNSGKYWQFSRLYV